MDNKVKITDIIGYYEMVGHWFSCLKNKRHIKNNKNTVEPLSFDKTGKMCNIAQLFKNWLHFCRLGKRITRKIIIKKTVEQFLHVQEIAHANKSTRALVCVRAIAHISGKWLLLQHFSTGISMVLRNKSLPRWPLYNDMQPHIILI